VGSYYTEKTIFHPVARLSSLRQIEKDIEMKCPICGSKQFYLKDPTDEYETYEFELDDGRPVFPAEPRELRPDTESFCRRCSWHGRWEELCPR